MNERKLVNYAELVVKRGVSLKAGQSLVISSDINNAYFVRHVTDAAYACGAREVTVRWSDEHITRALYLNADDKVFDEYPDWHRVFYDHYDNRDAVYVSIVSADPDLLKNVDPSRIKRFNKLANKALEKHSDLLMGSYARWTVTAVPSVKWAKKVFPELSENEAFEKLWDAIASCARVDNDDPIGAWEKHGDSFTSKLNYLNEAQFESLHYKNALGTDVVIGLPENHIWYGGGEKDKKGVYFFANMPTEEIFTLPHKDRVDGKIVSSMPLIYQGNAIEGMSLEFRNGRVVSYHADTNVEILKNIIETDEGAGRLGEVALVPQDSPISQMNILFFNTLFDENASCHFALGKAYGSCLKDDDKMSKTELSERGCNDSLVHVDFMAGTADLSITGTKKNGEIVDIFVNGNYAI